MTKLLFEFTQNLSLIEFVYHEFNFLFNESLVVDEFVPSGSDDFEECIYFSITSAIELFIPLKIKRTEMITKSRILSLMEAWLRFYNHKSLKPSLSVHDLNAVSHHEIKAKIDIISNKNLLFVFSNLGEEGIRNLQIILYTLYCHYDYVEVIESYLSDLKEAI